MPGTLFVVATPIGNLEDLTFRALRTLKEVDLIAAEDTRRTAKLLAHYEIRKPLVSLREHNESREAPRLLDRVSAGENIALVSDAGTPGIADPGARLVRAAHERRVKVVPIPGPSAVATALSVSGFGGDQFVFAGFPPASGSRRGSWLKQVGDELRPVIFFEAPHRIRRTLNELAPLLGKKQILIARELSKKFEELVKSPNTDPDEVNEAGEFTVVVGPGADEPSRDEIDLIELATLIGRLTNSALFSNDEIARIVSGLYSWDDRTTRKAIKKARILVNNQKGPLA
jgi:16S rRNA (cytidine1402-2'-O)-methyltransferase